MQKKFLSLPILVLSILNNILIFVLIGLAAAAAVAAGAATSVGADAATAGVVGAGVGTILVSLLMSGISLAVFIMQIIATIRIKSENTTIMVLYIVGFFFPICTIIAASMAIYKKLY
ncbi:hypothetical protein [Mycoplasma sp. 1232]|uniref:hypothetical protein n=1 Tax=Mycoplasma sp. 1232 TaxID=3108527 RepID=UPI002B262784|nr:hypothetical protein [Mycoplasma sp. 1232]MEA4333903.1 hypothetical protein [Mycoplasma sp. 1232]